MLKNSLILSSLLALTACQNVPVKQSTSNDNLVVDIFHTGTEDDDRDGVDNLHDQCPNTPLNVVVDVKGCPISSYYEELPMRPELRVYYGENSSYPQEQYFEDIKKMAEKMQKFPNSFIQIEGHASKGEKNPDSVSRERAFIIAQILKEKYGISENQMSVNFYGNQRPIAPNDTKEGRAMNQRVYAIISNNP